MIGCAVSIVFKLMAKWFPAWGTAPLTCSATVLILGLVAAMSLYIGIRMVIGAKAEVAAKKARDRGGEIAGGIDYLERR